ncbi:hypothetical protein B0H14DRAFT_3480862 [Mycena olivaceomarginata]|nr:hypothetical protein B0H14DRAFT_3480862 [Mycena olivaceomarginata]
MCTVFLASAVAITRADAETAKAARTIEDLLKEATAGADARIKDLEKQLQQPVASGPGSSKPATAKKEHKGPNVPAAATTAAAGGRSGSVKLTKKTSSSVKGKGKAVADNRT